MRANQHPERRSSVAQRCHLVTLSLAVMNVVPAAGQATVVSPVPIREIPIQLADLTRVASMAESSDGALAVAQPEDQLVKVFLANGTVQMVGRAGEGPGEFRSPIRVGWLGDSLWVLDGTLQRVTVFGPDRRLVRTYLAPSASDLLKSAGVAGSGRFRPAIIGVTQGGGVAVALILPSGTRTDPITPSDSGLGSPVYVYAGAGARPRSLGRRARSESIQCRLVVQNSSASVGFRLPLCSEGVDAISPDGAWFASATPEQGASAGESWVELELRRHDGSSIYRVRQALSSKPIPTSEIRELRRSLETRQTFPAPLREAIREASFPTHYPPVSDLLVSTDGEMWLEKITGSGTSEWLVLDVRGQPRLVVTFPDGFTPRAVRQDGVWGTHQTELGELSLVKYRIGR